MYDKQTIPNFALVEISVQTIFHYERAGNSDYDPRAEHAWEVKQSHSRVPHNIKKKKPFALIEPCVDQVHQIGYESLSAALREQTLTTD